MMRKAVLSGLCAVALAGCVSTELRSYVGKPIEEAFFSYGAPEHVFELPDGQRAYQFRIGGGAVMTPGTSTATGTTIGNVTTVNTTSFPAAVYASEGCLVTLLAKPSGSSYTVTDFRMPNRVVC